MGDTETRTVYGTPFCTPGEDNESAGSTSSEPLPLLGDTVGGEGAGTLRGEERGDAKVTLCDSENCEGDEAVGGSVKGRGERRFPLKVLSLVVWGERKGLAAGGGEERGRSE